MPCIEDHECLPPYPETTRRCGFDREVRLLSRPHEPNHWDDVFKLVDKTDRAYCEQKKHDLERLHQFALLISCCLATIIFDSFKWLFNSNGSFIANRLSPRSTGAFLPYRTALIINALWFSSLILSVSTLLLSCVCHRSLEGFLGRPQFDAKHLLAFRQMRYNSMRRCRIFDICDAAHLMIPLAFVISFSGVIILSKSLQHPDLFVIVGALSAVLFFFLAMGLHPLFWSLFARHFISSFSPFNSPFSWLLFKLGHSLLFRSLRLASHASVSRSPTSPSYPGLSNPPLERISLAKLVPQALTSRDWLEEDCFHFFHPDHAEIIDVLLADALVWVESNPTIEKSSKLVASIYYCISDLKSPKVFSHLEYGLERAQEGLAGVFQTVAAQEQLGKYNSRTLASTLWLQMHVNGISYFQLAVSLLAESNMEKGLSSEYHPLNLVLQLLALARNGLASGTYLEGTFNIIRILMLGKQNMISEDLYVQHAILDILDESERYFKTGKYKDQYHRAELCAVELEHFIHTADDAKMSSLPKKWAIIVGRASDVHNLTMDMIPGTKSFGRAPDVHDMVARDMILRPTCSDSPRSSLPPSRSSTLVENDNSCSAVVLANRQACDISDVA